MMNFRKIPVYGHHLPFAAIHPSMGGIESLLVFVHAGINDIDKSIFAFCLRVKLVEPDRYRQYIRFRFSLVEFIKTFANSRNTMFYSRIVLRIK